MMFKYVCLAYIGLFWSGIAYTQTILVTGGAGFIGAHLVERLLNQNKVIIVDNFYMARDGNAKRYDVLKKLKIQNLQEKYPESLVIYSVDISDRVALEDIFKRHKIDIVCHLAAAPGVRLSIEDPALCFSTNLMGTLNLFECMRQYEVLRCIFASSSSVYGQSRQDQFYETQSTDRQINPYAVSKKSAELLAYTYYYLYGIQTTCLRFFSVYGPYGRFDMAAFLFMDAIAHDRPITLIGDGSAIRDFTYINDIVDGILQAIDKPLGYEIINLGSGDIVTLKDFVKTMEKVMGKKAVIRHAPSNPADALFTHSSIKRAKNLLDYQPRTDVEQGLTEMYEWYKQEQTI
jgi:UDP-glucuronate 4-epimerase